jgi:hypothetical protein
MFLVLILFLGKFANIQKATISFVVSGRRSVRVNQSAPIVETFLKFDGIFGRYVEEIIIEIGQE